MNFNGLFIDRMNEIDRENKILYDKLLNIHSKQVKRVDHSSGKKVFSLILYLKSFQRIR